MKIFINDYSINCSLGDNKQDIFSSLLSPKLNEVDKTTLVDGSSTPIMKVDCLLPKIENKFKNHNSRNNQLVLHSLLKMEKNLAELIAKYGPERIGVIMGTSTSGISEGIDAISKQNQGLLPKDYEYSLQEIGSPALFIKDYLELNSLAYSISTACTSGARTFIEGARLLENDICDAVIVGGCDSLNSLTLNGFHSLEALSLKRTNPFSKNRSGINIGEGCGLFILSKQESDLMLIGVGESTDGHHISAPDPSGAGATAAMSMALNHANIDSSSIDYINLHGTGTNLNDSMESMAVDNLFPDRPFASSTKPLTGHTLGAAGAIEAGFCLMSLEKGSYGLPVHHWDHEDDPKCAELNFVNQQNKLKPKVCMSNSYAFGGNNVSLIFKGSYDQ